MKCSIVGYYGANFGDLLMLKVLLDSVESHMDEIFIFTYGDKARLEGLLKGRRDYAKLRVVGLAGGGVVARFVGAVRGSRFIAWGGGTCFMDEGGTGGVKYMLIAKAMGVPVYYIGVGVDSCSKLSTKAYVAVSCLLSDGVFARDGASSATFSKYAVLGGRSKIGLMPDLAYGLDYGAIDTNRGGAERALVVCLRGLEGYVKDPNAVTSRLLALGERIARDLECVKVVVLVGDAEVDSEVSEVAESYFSQRHLPVRIVDGAHLEESLDAIRDASFVLSVRLHPAVVAQSFGVPYALFNYSAKNLKFLEQVGQEARAIHVGSEDCFCANFQKPDPSSSRSNRRAVVDSIGSVLD